MNYGIILGNTRGFYRYIYSILHTILTYYSILVFITNDNEIHNIMLVSHLSKGEK